ncbi:pyridoxal 5'-phosphate synthase glutaminase subunit PdxT [Candidatus Peregrinibacteria bacterium]|nr:pyridoxal 5'-phosphate synthase glutaminase subunit PdxT [Candidatus Peregrinibacteria bacterium]
MTVGVLAFHGDFAEHLEVLRNLKVKCIEVLSLDDLKKVSHLIIPGGESTVIGKFLESTGVGAAIKKRVNKRSLAIYGTCAGAILLARTVKGKNPPKSLKLMNITIERNAYGSQMQSFQADIGVKGLAKPLPATFIRAPIILDHGSAEILAEYGGHPVLVREGRILAGTFHPEVRGQEQIHRIFLTM